METDSNFIGIFNALKNEFGRDLTNVEKDRLLSKFSPKRNKNGEYVDVSGKSISYKNIPNLKKCFVKMTMPRVLIDEYILCSRDIFYFIQNYCKILTKSGVSFIENRAYQNDLIQMLLGKNDNILNMPRQSGKSITVALYLIHVILFKKNKNVGILSNRLALSMEILDKIKKIYLELPIFLQQGIVSWNKTYIELENGCKVMTAAASSDSFRGYTIHYLIVDEVAFISNENWEHIEDSIFPSQYALSEHKNILISTPNGLNHWYYKVKNAKSGISGYDYFEVDWKIVPRYDNQGNLLTSDKFKEQIVKKFGLQHFLQNYALEFLGSSKTLISSDILSSIIPVEPLEISNDLTDNLRIFERAAPQHKYVIGCDPNRGGMDNIGIQVIDVTFLPFKQVASAQLNISYFTLPEKLHRLGTYYNNALVVIENNLDESISNVLFYEYEYENVYKENGKKTFGFRTTKKTKRLILSLLKRFIETENLRLFDEKTIAELNVFVDNEKGSFEAQSGYHDDMVMSLAVAISPFIDMQNFNDYKKFIDFLKFQNQNDITDFKIMSDLAFSTEITDNDKIILPIFQNGELYE